MREGDCGVPGPPPPPNDIPPGVPGPLIRRGELTDLGECIDGADCVARLGAPTITGPGGRDNLSLN